jgi:hypothetical protein
MPAAIHIKYPKIDLIFCGSLSTVALILFLCFIIRFMTPLNYWAMAIGVVFLSGSIHFWLRLWRNQTVLAIDGTGICYRQQLWPWERILSFHTVKTKAVAYTETADHLSLVLKSWDKQSYLFIPLTSLAIDEQQFRQWVNDYCPAATILDEGHFEV